ncbi:MAG: hypothetical protein RLZZ81_200 [Pseudomonadota bacterium]|jgi:hypothetical protein
MKQTTYDEEIIDDEKKQSLFEKMMMSAKNTKLTPEYLHTKGVNLYSNAIILYQEKKVINDAIQKKFIQSIKYLQAAMIVGKLEACFVVNDFYHKDYLNLAMPEVGHLVSIIGYKLSNVTVPENAKLDKHETLEKLAAKKVRFINEAQKEWNPKISYFYKETSYLEPLIEKFNSDLPRNYQLISRNRTCKELNKEIDDFSMIELTQFNQEGNSTEVMGNTKSNDIQTCCFEL